MLTKRIIPCLDVKDGRVVKGINFANFKDAGDPVGLAKYYNEQGADELSFLDITASYEKRKIIINIIKKVAKEVFIPLSVGGGINSVEVIRELLNAGAEKVSIGTAAVKNPDLVKDASNKFGSQAIVLSIDAKRKNNSWTVYIKGGREDANIDALKFAKKMEQNGAGEILLNSIDMDGTKEGYDLELTKTFSEELNIPIIASGGAGSLQHIKDVLTKGKADAALAASIFHYKQHSIEDVKKYLKRNNVEVRL
ncbi:MAG: imidazole glycerol phosphate synthase subunit HisF [Nanoarchaeota archaeon]